jgi:hypothetical protein
MGHQLRPRHDDQHDHDDEHGHDHGSGLARLVHPVTEVFGGHCHDSADQVDSALESDAAGRRALVISLAGLLATAALQAIVVVISGSVALLGEDGVQRVGEPRHDFGGIRVGFSINQ